MNQETTIDRFEWRRVGMLWSLYAPALKKQLVLYPLLTVALVALYIIMVRLGISQTTACAFSGYVLAFMFYLAPIALARRDYRCISGQLPVTAGEKMAFLVVYFWGAVFAITMGLYYALHLGLYLILPQYYDWVVDFFFVLTYFPGHQAFSRWIVFSSVVTMITMQLFTLYGVLSAKRNRMLRGITYMIVAFVLLMVVSGIGGIIVGIIIGYQAAMRGEVIAPDDMVDTVRMMASSMIYVVGIVNLCTGIAGAAMYCKTLKLLRRGGF